MNASGTATKVADPVLRDAVEGDFAAIRAIYAHYVLTSTCTFEEVPPTEAELLRRWAEVVGRGLPWIVAEQSGRVVGYAYANWFRPRTAFRHSCEDSIYLAPDVCSAGLGTRLLGELVARCTAAGSRQMVAVIGDSANVASQRLHARLGFAPAGKMDNVGWKLGRWLDTVILQRPLGPGAATPPSEREADQ